MISYYYAGFDGWHHHGSINDDVNGIDQLFIGKTKEELSSFVQDYNDEVFGGKAEIKISGI